MKIKKFYTPYGENEVGRLPASITQQQQLSQGGADAKG